jgi:hypothetical protein
LGFNFFLTAVTQIAADNRKDMSNVQYMSRFNYAPSPQIVTIFLLPFFGCLLIFFGGGEGVEDIG